MKHTTSFLAATAVAALFASGAAAVTLDITQIDAGWQNVVGGNAGHTIDNSDPDNVVVSWPASGPNQSSYQFQREALPIEGIAPETVFQLGTFTHNNFPIPLGSGISSVELAFTFGGTIGPFSRAFNAIFDFDHDETRNDPALCPGDAIPCDDFAVVTAQDGDSETLILNGQRVIFTFLGFGQTPGDASFSNVFRSPEGGSNSVGLFATYTIEPVVPIPLPAAGWLLLGGLGALGAVARRRRKAA